MPAVERYSGSFYQAARAELVRAVSRGLHVLIVSGGYGVLTTCEPIGLYDAAFNPAWWPRQVVADCVAAYADRHGLTSMVAFLAASTGYARALRNIGGTPQSQNLKQAFLVTAVAEGGGAMQTVPRAL